MALTVLPTISFDNGLGDDSNESGSVPSSPVKAGGNDGASTDGTTTVDLSADSPDLSGVPQDGSAVLWVFASTGRQFSRISTVDDGAKTVVCENAFANTEADLAWGLGGFRVDLSANVQLLLDLLPGWTVDIIQTGTDYESTDAELLDFSVAGSQAVGFINILSSSATKPILKHNVTVSGRSIQLSVGSSYIRFQNLAIERFKADGAIALPIVYGLSGGVFQFQDVEIYASGGAAAAAGVDAFELNVNSVTLRVSIIDCHIHDVGGTGIQKTSGSERMILQIVGNRIADCGEEGIDVRTTGGAITDNIVTGCGGNGIALNSVSDGAYITGNTVDGNTGSGLFIAAVATNDGVMILNNNFTANGAYGIEFASAVTRTFVEDYNNFGSGGTANTSGAISHSIPIGDNSLNVDPQYTATGSDDYSVGANVKALGFPDADRNIGADQSGTVTFVDIGAAQREEPAGGGGGSNSIIGG